VYTFFKKRVKKVSFSLVICYNSLTIENIFSDAGEQLKKDTVGITHPTAKCKNNKTSFSHPPVRFFFLNVHKNTLLKHTVKTRCNAFKIFHAVT